MTLKDYLMSLSVKGLLLRLKNLRRHLVSYKQEGIWERKKLT
jgi:hypothetical protein